MSHESPKWHPVGGRNTGMRVTWLVVCERVLILGERLSAMNIYQDPVPWRGPDIGVPFGAIMSIAPLDQELDLQQVAIRILSEGGQPVAESEGMLPAAAVGRLGKAFIEGHVSVEKPGRYTLEILVDGEPMDDAPSWDLHFAEK